MYWNSEVLADLITASVTKHNQASKISVEYPIVLFMGFLLDGGGKVKNWHSYSSSEQLRDTKKLAYQEIKILPLYLIKHIVESAVYLLLCFLLLNAKLSRLSQSVSGRWYGKSPSTPVKWRAEQLSEDSSIPRTGEEGALSFFFSIQQSNNSPN